MDEIIRKWLKWNKKHQTGAGNVAAKENVCRKYITKFYFNWLNERQTAALKSLASSIYCNDDQL